ncbi:hypothetical protein [Micromonospora sp. RTP1Z1]|uniref:hypothetical protein n=1 Tax=Micromonospora sp. RTP1Z1 TaxID=2994043 RepID=UPI0029C641C4|nr:hypothetical protein [Micromonospora sp. RTP1Z1]
MKSPLRTVGGFIRGAVSHRDLDLYVLAASALVFTLLGSAGMASAAALSSATLGLLTFLAVAQIRSRSQVADIADARRIRHTDVLRSNFPENLVGRRQDARSLLLIGRSLGRTIETSRAYLRRSLAAGAHIRVLLVDPDDEGAVHVAASSTADFARVERLQARIRASLEELAGLQGAGGRLEVRVTTAVPSLGVNAIDIEYESGLIVVQHYEYRPSSEAAPILRLDTSDGVWFHHFVAEANRMWEDGQSWPPTADRAVRRAARPAFAHAFGPELVEVMSRARHLFITGVTRNTLLTSEYGRFEQWLKAGCVIRLLLVDPESPAIAVAAERYYAHRSPERTRERVRHALGLLGELRQTTGGDIAVRLTRHPLALGLIAVDPTEETRSPNSAVFGEYYTYQAPGEPKFTIRANDGPWCDHFVEEAEALWDGAAPVKL